MGSSAKKKKEKKQDFQKPKLKVGKARPKNTNATDTSFAAKSIVFKQQNLSEGSRDPKTLFNHNLSLLSASTETQRRDALQYLTSAVHSLGVENLPQPASAIVSKAQPLILDASLQVRQQLIKLLRALPVFQLGSVDQLLLYARAGMAQLSPSIRETSLDILDWLLETNGEAVVACAGGWIKTLQTLQNLLAWHDQEPASASAFNKGTLSGTTGPSGTKWSNLKTATNMSGNKLPVHLMTSLARLLHVGLVRPDAQAQIDAAAMRAGEIFPLWHFDAHSIVNDASFASTAKPYGYLNLFGAPRDLESEIYDNPDDRAEVFIEAGFLAAFRHGVKEARKEGGELGRAAAAVDKSLRFVALDAG